MSPCRRLATLAPSGLHELYRDLWSPRCQGLPSWRRRTTSTAAPRKHPDEFRGRAIREVRATGRPIAHVAKDLGIHKEALRGWIRQAEAARGERDDRLTTAEQDELKLARHSGPAPFRSRDGRDCAIACRNRRVSGSSSDGTLPRRPRGCSR